MSESDSGPHKNRVRAQSVHGGALGIEDQVLRATLRRQLFGEGAAVRIGRFEVRRQLGAGGMGSVFEAHDSDHDRDVALKTVRYLDESQHQAVSRRMMREAKILSRLDHPNVVSVYEVGEHEGSIFIAMELVRGQTLRNWIEHSPRSWSEILERYLQAGRGLSAAHQRGIVHRDFKPDNVLIDDEHGVAHVVDFGLARGGRSDSPGSGLGEYRTQTPLTADGSPLGTVAYMSPEQARGDTVDTRSDVYSFCVSLYEGLYGELPPPVAAIVGVKPGEPRAAGARDIVPAYIRHVLERGMRDDPSSRPKTISALMDRLTRRPRRWPRWVVGAAGVAAVAGVVIWVALDEAPPRCEVVEPLGAQARDAIRSRIAQHDQPYSATVGQSVVEGLDDAMARLREYSSDVCSAHDRGELFGTQFDAAQECVATLRAELGSFAERFGPHEPIVAALEDLSALPEVSECDRQGRVFANADVASSELRAAQSTLVRGVLELDEGAVDTAVSLAMSVRARTAELDDTDLSVGALIVLSVARWRQGNEQAAWSLLAEATELARDSSAAIPLGWALARQTQLAAASGRSEEVIQDLAAKTLAAASQVPQSALRHAAVIRAQAGQARCISEPSDSATVQRLRDSLDELERVIGRRDPQTIRARLGLALCLHRANELLSAVELAAAVVEESRALWGAGHPVTAEHQGEYGRLLAEAERFPEARHQLETALAAFGELLGPNHPYLARWHYELAVVLRGERDHLAAAEHLRRGLDLREVPPPARPALPGLVSRWDVELVTWLYALGHEELAAGRLPAARRTLLRADRLARTSGVSDTRRAEILLDLAKVVRGDRRGQAEAFARQALGFTSQAPRLREAVEQFLGDAELPDP